MGTVVLKPLPAVDIQRWMDAYNPVDLKFDVLPKMSPRGTPAVLLFHGNRCVLSVWGEAHSDGIAMHFVARPNEQGTPLICMKFKEWKPERAMAAIVAVLAFHVEKPRLPRKLRLADEWLKKVRDAVQKHFYKERGSFVERGIHQVLADVERRCEHRFNCLAGLDVKEAMDRVRKDFRLLVEHMSEEDVLTMWRETIVAKVMRS